MNKIVINSCYGGFSLSKKAVKWLTEHGSNEARYTHIYGYWSGSRHNPLLVKCVEELGDEASGACAQLEIETIEGNLYRIEEYDGMETVITPSNQDYTKIEQHLTNMSKTIRKTPPKHRNEDALAAWQRGGAGTHDSKKREKMRELEELQEQIRDCEEYEEYEE